MCVAKQLDRARGVTAVFCGALLIILTTSLVSAQGFMVKPMRIEAEPRAGQTIEIPLQVRNTVGEGTRSIELSLVELSQALDGSWEIAGDEDIDPAVSSMLWTALSATRLEVPPLAPAEIMVRMTPPANARGAYVVGVIAETPAPQQSSGLAVRMRFLIPVIIEIKGRPAQQNIRLEDVEMVYHDGSNGKPATTSAHLRIENSGQTFSRVSGQLSVERRNGDRWRPVTRFEVRERSIIPGVRLELGDDLERRLPSGDYRLRGQLFVDGRRVPSIEKEVAFTGDPGATLAYDTALLLQPALVDAKVVPGATRTAVLSVENPGTDAVTVRILSATPRDLTGVEMGQLNGQELSAEPWTTIRPDEFTIRPGGKQNVRVLSSVPKEGIVHPHYYADLVLSGSYADGQSAGETRSTIHLSQPTVESVANGIVEQISFAAGDTPAKYIVDLRFANIGNVHLNPKAQVFLLSAQGRSVRSIALSGLDATLLPLGKRSFSGEIDLEDLEPGYFAVNARVTSGEGIEFSRQEIIRIEDEIAADNPDAVVGRSVTLIDPASEKLPEGFTQDSDATGSGNSNDTGEKAP